MNSKTIIYSIIVILVVAALVFVTINNKNNNKAMPFTNTATNSNNTLDSGSNVSQSANPGQVAAENSGVTTTVIKEGTGATAKTGDTVSMKYTGTLSDGTVFDSNIDPKFGHVQPFTFTLGAGRVIKGWDEGIVGMKTGEERKLVISPDYAYGANGIPGVIPPNATLTFDVTLLSISGNK